MPDQQLPAHGQGETNQSAYAKTAASCFSVPEPGTCIFFTAQCWPNNRHNCDMLSTLTCKVNSRPKGKEETDREMTGGWHYRSISMMYSCNRHVQHRGPTSRQSWSSRNLDPCRRENTLLGGTWLHNWTVRHSLPGLRSMDLHNQLI